MQHMYSVCSNYVAYVYCMQQVCNMFILYAASMQLMYIVCSKYATYVYRMNKVCICIIICGKHMQQVCNKCIYYIYIQIAYSASMQHMYIHMRVTLSLYGAHCPMPMHVRLTREKVSVQYSI